jgi:hypothetical protein
LNEEFDKEFIDEMMEDYLQSNTISAVLKVEIEVPKRGAM